MPGGASYLVPDIYAHLWNKNKNQVEGQKPSEDFYATRDAEPHTINGFRYQFLRIKNE